MEINEVLDKLKDTMAWKWGNLVEKTASGEYKPSKYFTRQCIYEALYGIQSLFSELKHEHNEPPEYKYIRLSEDVLNDISSSFVDSIVRWGPESERKEKLLSVLWKIRNSCDGSIELRYKEANRGV